MVKYITKRPKKIIPLPPIKPKPIKKRIIQKKISKIDQNTTKISQKNSVALPRKKLHPILPHKADIKAKYINLNLKKITSAINDAKFYPYRARKLHIEGDVKVRFLLRKDGSIKIEQIKTVKRFLKKASAKIIKNASSDFPKPPENIQISVTIVFKLDE